jgi:hypothetical protein
MYNTSGGFEMTLTFRLESPTGRNKLRAHFKIRRLDFKCVFKTRNENTCMVRWLKDSANLTGVVTDK